VEFHDETCIWILCLSLIYMSTHVCLWCLFTLMHVCLLLILFHALEVEFICF
jgi:hypothetical protein